MHSPAIDGFRVDPSQFYLWYQFMATPASQNYPYDGIQRSGFRQEIASGPSARTLTGAWSGWTRIEATLTSDHGVEHPHDRAGRADRDCACDNATR